MMMFTRLGRSISQSYRSRNVFGGGNGGRLQTLTRSSSVYQSRYIRQADDNLGVLKHYFGSLAANNGRNGSGLSSKVYISDINLILANPRIRRFFSSEAPKKEDDDNFHSKEMIETPMGNNQKSESKEESSTEDIEEYYPLVIMAFLLVLLFFLLSSLDDKIDFKKFKNKYLKERLVDHIVVINNSVAEVHVRRQPPDPYVYNYGENRTVKVYMNIESKETFEEQLKEAQEELAREFHVPVLYTFK